MKFSILDQVQLIENTTLNDVHEYLFALVLNGLRNKITSGKN